MIDALRSLAPIWSLILAVMPLLFGTFVVLVALLVGSVVARAFGLGPDALAWRLQSGLANRIIKINSSVGQMASWLALFMVIVQFVIVLMSYVFSVGFIWLQESMTYMHAALFMLAAAYTLGEDGHVRVDVFFRTAGIQQKSLTDFLGHLVLLIPLMVLTLQVAYPYVARSWASFEGSKETSGIQAVFLLKTLILVFAGTLLLQAYALAVRAGHRFVGGAEPGGSGSSPGQAI